MKRRHFIKTTAIAGIGTTLIPNLGFSSTSPIISEDELIGKGNPKLLGKGYQLRPEAHEAFIKMQAAAEKDGFKIQAVSSYRNFAHQKRIWERKFKRYKARGLSDSKNIAKIIEYSTIPGTSRHHWGTDIDIIDGSIPQPKNVLNPNHFHGYGVFCPFREWLEQNANTYGFYLAYTDAFDRKGFKYEPWHYSYKPLSYEYLKAYRNINIKSVLQQEQLSGINAFTEDFVNTYITNNILDINPELL